jgi:hypothetical protein
MSLILIAVILLSLIAGVGLGYAIIFGILDLFDRSRQLFNTAPAQTLNASPGHD